MSTLSSAYLIPILIMPNHKRKITKPRKISSPLTALVSPPLWSLVHLSCARPRRPVSAVQAVVWELKEWIQPSHPCPASTPGRTGRLRGLNQYPAISQTGSPDILGQICRASLPAYFTNFLLLGSFENTLACFMIWSHQVLHWLFFTTIRSVS